MTATTRSAEAGALLRRLRLPVIVAPMFLVSGPELVIAASRAGLMGAFPAANARDPVQLRHWFETIEAGLADGPPAAPYAVNLVLAPRPGGEALASACIERRPPVVITSNGDPTAMAREVQGWGGLIFHDVTTIRHAEKAAAAGVDGIIVVCAGAGGHTGLASPFALVQQVRRRFGGLIILAGAVSDGAGILAAQAMGADLVYMGTRFIATDEATAPEPYKHMVVTAGTSDVVYTDAISGLPANFMRQSIEAAGLDPACLPGRLAPQKPDLPGGLRAWRDIWSAGHGVGLIDEVLSVAGLSERLEGEYRAAAERIGALTQYG